MKKVSIQGISIIALFFITWLVFSQINWLQLLEIEKSGEKMEQELGEKLWEIYANEGDEISNDTVINALDTLISTICEVNDIGQEKIKLHVLEKDEVNAFAMPDGHLVVYTGLIKEIDKQEELTGVICHELAHIELNHVMKKLAKEVGISMLISLTTGSSGNGIAEVGKLLSSTAFDRKFEQQADLKAVDYLINAEIHPEHLANFLYKMSLDNGTYTGYFSWISTHPDSKERAQHIIEAIDMDDLKNQPILNELTWQNLKNILK